jgi:hypothetical protein
MVVAMAEETLITLRYIGPDVDDGSIGVDDLLSALNGFSSAFYKVSERIDLDQPQRLKVRGISRSSANILISVLQFAKVHETAVVGGATTLAASAFAGTNEAVKGTAKRLADKVLNRIVGTAKAKKHTQDGTYTVGNVEGDNNRVLIINNLNVALPVDKGVFDLFKEGTIDSDLDKMTAPLQEDAINAFEIKHDEQEYPDLRLEASDRPYFAKPRQTRTTTTQETELIGTLNSLSKTSHSGVFIMDSGKRIRYRLAGEDMGLHYSRFAHLGQVRVRCIAKLNNDLDVVSIEISDIQPYDPAGAFLERNPQLPLAGS